MWGAMGASRTVSVLSAMWYSAEPAMLLLSWSTLDSIISADTATLNVCRRSITSVTCAGGGVLWSSTLRAASLITNLLNSLIGCHGEVISLSPVRHCLKMRPRQPIQAVQPTMDSLDGCSR